MKLRYFLGIATIVGLTVFNAHVASAQETGGQALEIAPPVVNLTADPGQTITTQVSLRDISSNDLFVTSEFNDFTAAGEDGTPKIIMEPTEDNPYSIRDWIAPIAPLTLKPREIKNLPITIRVPADAAPGGYYGVIRFTGTPPELDSTGVSLSASIGALVFIRVNGVANEKLALESFEISKDGNIGTFFEASPLTFSQRLRNTGNTFVQPAGVVTIKDTFNRTIATLGVNQPPRNILPGTIRKFDQPLDRSVIGDKRLFGRYTAEVKITYGTQTLTETMTFWVIPYKLIGGGIIALVALFFILRFLVQRYNRQIIKKAQNQRRR